ncbi:hypothetical protein F5J12DRAFT_894161 [Pisolithus orientalis]|uniref:uncharacterized protein n=1 Tax=Pisolithus orientalis TaxID=936130 RepID=UPI002225A586|nr:uncharacterized protein F5J12DRAFT_894161 [Pisolithus orientalis]KAI6002394.1 hypothetical protein F5J12DRAFT_894161 [Pisolithus orientalis]
MSFTSKLGDDFLKVPKLLADGENWVTYKDRLMWSLDAHGLLRYIDGTETMPVNPQAGIYLWWKYINENKISIPKVHNANLCDMTKESMIWQNEAIPTAIAIADLWQPEGQCRFNIDDLFEDYQEWVGERAQLEAERLAKAPSMHTQGQAARGEGQDHAPEDTKGNPSRGAAHLTGEGSGSASKGKGKQKATSKEDELADNIDDDEGDGEPGPSAKGPCTAGDNEPCEMCAQANLTCIGEPEASCKWCRKAKCKCSHSQGIGRKNSGTIGEAGPSHKQVKSFTTLKLAPAESVTKPVKKLTPKILAQKWQPDLTPTHSPSPDPAPLPAPCLFFHRATPMPRPSFKPSPVPVNDPHVSLLINEPQVKIEPFFATVTSLLDEPGDVKVTAQSNTPLAAEIPEVEYQHEWSTANIIECLRVVKARAKDKEFKLEQVYWLLEMLSRWVTHQIKTVWARWEELQRLKDNLWDL